MRIYPVGLVIEGKPCVVVGGGRVAQRKVEGLLAAGAVVEVISPEATASLAPAALRRGELRQELEERYGLEYGELVELLGDASRPPRRGQKSGGKELQREEQWARGSIPLSS